MDEFALRRWVNDVASARRRLDAFEDWLAVIAWDTGSAAPATADLLRVVEGLLADYNSGRLSLTCLRAELQALLPERTSES